MKKNIFVFLFIFIFSNNLFSMINFELFDDLLEMDEEFDDLGEYSGLEELLSQEDRNKFVEEIVPGAEKKEIFTINSKAIIDKILELQGTKDALSEKDRKKLFRIFIIKLYEIIYDEIDFNVGLKIKNFLGYLNENNINVEYSYLKNLLCNFKKSSLENKKRIRSLANKNLIVNEDLSYKEMFIRDKALSLQKKRMQTNRKRRFKLEILLIIKWYELYYGSIKDNYNDLNTKEFCKVLIDNDIEIDTKALSSILSRFKNKFLVKEDVCLDINVDSFLSKKVSFNEKQIINKILELEDKRNKFTNRQIRTAEEVAFILKLYVVCYGNPGKKIKLRNREFLQYLSENNIIMNLDSLRGILRNFKKLSESEILKKLEFADNCLQKNKIQSSLEEKIITRIINLKNGVSFKNLTLKKRAEITNRFLIKLYEVLYGPIKPNINLDIVNFLDYLKDVGYLKDNEYRKNRLRIKQSLLYFKKLSEDKKEIKRAEINKLL